MSTIKAVVAPRTVLDQLKLRPEASRTGIYFLVGSEQENPTSLRVYVGEGDDVLARLVAHSQDASKDYFDRVVLVVSKDENLTKAHVRWAEARLITRLRAANRCVVDNATQPVGGMLPEADGAEMIEFIDQLQLLLSALDLNIFEPVAQPLSPTPPSTEPEPMAFYLEGQGYSAQAALTDGEFVVAEGSRARPEVAGTISNAARAMRDELESAGVLRDNGGSKVFTQAYAFSSPSQAAQVVCGYSINGRTAWKTAAGIPYAAWETARLQSPSVELGPALTLD